MKVKVVSTSQVVHDGTRYAKGDTFDAPDPLAQKWIRAGYVEAVEAGGGKHDTRQSRSSTSNDQR